MQPNFHWKIVTNIQFPFKYKQTWRNGITRSKLERLHNSVLLPFRPRELWIYHVHSIQNSYKHFSLQFTNTSKMYIEFQPIAKWLLRYHGKQITLQNFPTRWVQSWWIIKKFTTRIHLAYEVATNFCQFYFLLLVEMLLMKTNLLLPYVRVRESLSNTYAVRKRELSFGSPNTQSDFLLIWYP